uniref:Uncharacterized protein n=1 Tax=Arundo donax TaxID=35708 RepID=A0A0A9GNF1_ARUDO
MRFLCRPVVQGLIRSSLLASVRLPRFGNTVSVEGFMPMFGLDGGLVGHFGSRF